MAIRENSVYAIRNMAQDEREKLGFLVLVMRQWARGIPATMIDARIPDAAPSQLLLNQASIKKNLATPEKILPWETFQERYLAEQQAQDTCRVVFYDGEGKPHKDWWDCSPIEALIRLEVERGNVTLLCWEPSGCNCHRIPLLAAVQQCKAESRRICIEAINTALGQSSAITIRIRVHTAWESTRTSWDDAIQQLLREVAFSTQPYMRLGNTLLYSALIQKAEQAKQLLSLPYLYGIEIMPTLSPAITAQGI